MTDEQATKSAKAVRWMGGLQEDILVRVGRRSPAVQRTLQRTQGKAAEATNAEGDLVSATAGRPWVPWDPPKTPANARSAYSKALRRLEKRGLVTRDRTNRRDDTKSRHTTRVRLTPTGVEAVVQLLSPEAQARGEPGRPAASLGPGGCGDEMTDEQVTLIRKAILTVAKAQRQTAGDLIELKAELARLRQEMRTDIKYLRWEVGLEAD